ncbi:S41 family peptidase [Hymenobacter sp. BT770]|uniref:S41 family peptidase n=1 Tax=Hymenobacter sp. BT770 TaxID=2886942 RepID=UPI001D11DF74|nr:S41 family peptidase [Hymenobacter sp. BT770]MCC3151737.1 hypothetical protein [Hymenobacter sp. BT770]MDO3413641.1 S41 family peptidase [Hymenobacter sp. BT770]
MKSFYLTVWLLLAFCTAALAQVPATRLNLDFEQVNQPAKQPRGWVSPGTDGYWMAADSVVRHGGRYALRLQSQGPRPDKSFGVARVTVPVNFQGKAIKLTGFMKTQNVQDGYAGLWLRVDGEASTLAFDNMSKQNVHGTTDWQAYTITLPLGEQAETLVLGGILPGSGTMWLDDLVLTVDDQPLAQARPKVAQLFKADLDTAFRAGSRIKLDNLTQQQVENLAVLGRVWGFVKYYHPAVARGEYNMDAAMLRVLPQVLKSENAAKRNQVLSTWLTGFGPVPACASCREPAPDSLRLQADLAWLQDKKQLGDALSKQLEYLRQNRNQGKHYYVRSAPGTGNPLFEHEYAYATPETPDAGLRLLSLYRYWNMIAYFFPYRYANGEDWQRVLPEFIPQFASAGTPEQYRLRALALIARIHDTHANIYGNDKVLGNYLGRYYAPVQVRFVEGQAVVTDYYNAALGAATTLQKGDVVLAVAGVKVSDMVKARQPLTPASNEPTQLRNISKNLLRGATEQVELLVRRDGRDFPVTISRYLPKELNLAVDTGTPSPIAPAWQLLPNNIGHLKLGTIHQAQLPEIMEAAKNTKGLVIDIRNYPSEFMVFALSQYLLAQPTKFVRFSRPVITYPGMFERIPGPTLAAGKGTAYAGKVVILVNELSQSQAEYTTMAFRTVPGAKVVGSTTAGADGNVSFITLPGNISTAISGLGVYYPDGRETQRVGIVPDVAVAPTIRGIREGRDEVLEKAVQLIEQP